MLPTTAFIVGQAATAVAAALALIGAKATFQNQVGFWKANVNVPGSTKTENINKPGTLTI